MMVASDAEASTCGSRLEGAIEIRRHARQWSCAEQYESTRLGARKHAVNMLVAGAISPCEREAYSAASSSSEGPPASETTPQARAAAVLHSPDARGLIAAAVAVQQVSAF